MHYMDAHDAIHFARVDFRKYPGVEAVMAHILNEVLLYCSLAAFVTGIVIAAASLIS